MCVFCSSRRRHTRYWRDWSSDVCSSDLPDVVVFAGDREWGSGAVAVSGPLPAVTGWPTGRRRGEELSADGDLPALPRWMRGPRRTGPPPLNPAARSLPGEDQRASNWGRAGTRTTPLVIA